MNTLRLTTSLLFLLAAGAPAFAGHFDLARIPKHGVLVQADACQHQHALDILDRAQMTFVAEVPRTEGLYRFVVDWKSDLFAVTVGTTDCRLEVVNYARAIQPYCNYVPGVMTSCRVDEFLMQ